jgi:hypothetical protein
VVLDDAVVHHRDVASDVRVGIRLARSSVSGPARVTDAGRSRELLVLDGPNQVVELPYRADDFDSLSVVNGQPGGVVTAVFELSQPVQKHRRSVFRSDVADDAAHVS